MGSATRRRLCAKHVSMAGTGDRVVGGALSLDPPLSGSVLTLGTFDGVHLGHQALLGKARARAEQLALPSLAYTFDPHPARVLAPERAPGTLISLAERVRLLLAAGADRVVVEPFDAAFARITADDWVQRYLVERLSPRHVVVGFNFGYGRDRGGDPQHLRSAGERHGFSVEIVGPIKVELGDGDSVASSTRLRALILAGDVERAAMLLGRSFALTGRVVKGDERGRTIGVPTANLAPEADVLPAHGVYATRVVIDPPALGSGGPALRAVTNIGLRPTFAGRELRVESHLLDFTGDLYGKRLRVELVARVREERRFDGVDALLAQIRADISRARALLGG